MAKVACLWVPGPGVSASVHTRRAAGCPRRRRPSANRPAALPTPPSRRHPQAPGTSPPSRRPRSTSVWRAPLTARAKHKAPKTEPSERSQTPSGPIRRLLVRVRATKPGPLGDAWLLCLAAVPTRKAPLAVVFTPTQSFQSPFIVANRSAPCKQPESLHTKKAALACCWTRDARKPQRWPSRPSSSSSSPCPSPRTK